MSMHDQIVQELIEVAGPVLTQLLKYITIQNLRRDNIEQFRTKNNKLRRLIRRTDEVNFVQTVVPVKNLSGFDVDTSCFNKGLRHSFTDKNRYVKRNLAVELEQLAIRVDSNVPSEEKENFHEFLRSCTDKFTKNVYLDKDDTFKSIMEIKSNEDIVVLSGDKDSSVVLLKKKDYQDKVWSLIQEGIDAGKYELTDDSTHKDLKNFQQFLYNNFSKHKEYEKMRPASNRPARFFATAKTHKFQSFDEITLDELKLRPIVDQTGTHTQKAAKVVSKYLKPLGHNEYVIKDSLKFPELLKSKPLQEDEEDVSYDVESLFTSIPVRETIDFILSEIYDRKVIPPFCKKRLHFKRLLERLTGECKFSVNGVLVRQKDGCPIGGSMSGDFADIFMKKLERDVVIPRNPILYGRYVDDTYNRRKKNVPDELFKALNSYNPNIRCTIVVNPPHFLDTNIQHENGEVLTSVHVKENCIPVFWSSKVPKRYKRNAINGDLHRAAKIASDFDAEVRRIKEKYKNVGFPLRFIEAVIRDFQKVPVVDEGERIIPEWLFEQKMDFYIRLPFCPKNEEISRNFLQKLDEYTNNRYNFKIIWITRNIRSLFPLKDRVEHMSCVIYQGTCSCGESYIGETVRITDIRWKEHTNPAPSAKLTDPAKHVLANPTHTFRWTVLTHAPQQSSKRLILEAYFIAKKRPKINIQTNPQLLLLFRNGVT